MANGGDSILGQMHAQLPGQYSSKGEVPLWRASVRVDPAPSREGGASHTPAFQRIADVRYHLEMCAQSLKESEVAAKTALKDGQQVAIGVSPITIRTLAACLSELLKLEREQPHRDSCHDLCKLLDCPQQPVLRTAIEHSIEVLEATKYRFKSKELKRLREDLETLLVNSGDFLPSQKS